MDEIDYLKIGSKIRQARHDKDLSQEQLSELCNISTSYLGHIERGTRKLSVETLVSLCTNLEISTDYVLMDVLPSNDPVLISIINNAKKKGVKSYDRFITILKALSDVVDKL